MRSNDVTIIKLSFLKVKTLRMMMFFMTMTMTTIIAVSTSITIACNSANGADVLVYSSIFVVPFYIGSQ